MSEPCSETRMKALLHAYELGMISDEEKDAFEAHLLDCEDCFQQVKEFMPRATLLAVSPSIKKQLEASFAGEKREGSIWRKLQQVLWPEGLPVVLKPAALVCVMLLMLYPAYLGIVGSPGNQVVTVQEIGLVPTRSIQTFTVEPDQDVVLSFVCPGIIAGQTCTVTLYNNSGDVIHQEDDFSGIDSFSVGRLMIPHRLIAPGKYRLSLQAIPPVVSTVPDKFGYVFEVEFSSSQD